MNRITKTLVLALISGFGGQLSAQSQVAAPSSLQTAAQGDADGMREISRTADAGVGEVGQRQTRDDYAPRIEPTGRLSTRVENRIQNRLRNRIDQNYDATANATSPFERANQRVRNVDRLGPR